MVGKAIGIGEVRELMERLGITLNYKGFYYAVYAVRLAAEKPERLLLVTKWLYPEVARHYETTVNAVERDIRTVVGIIWRENRNGIMAGKAGLSGNHFCASKNGFVFAIFKNGTRNL